MAKTRPPYAPEFRRQMVIWSVQGATRRTLLVISSRPRSDPQLGGGGRSAGLVPPSTRHPTAAP